MYVILYLCMFQFHICVYDHMNLSKVHSLCFIVMFIVYDGWMLSSFDTFYKLLAYLSFMLQTQFLMLSTMLSSHIFISDEYSWCLVNFVFVTSMFFSWFSNLFGIFKKKMWQILGTLNWTFTFASYLSCLSPLIHNYSCFLEEVGFMIVELHFIIHVLYSHTLWNDVNSRSIWFSKVKHAYAMTSTTSLMDFSVLKHKY